VLTTQPGALQKLETLFSFNIENHIALSDHFIDMFRHKTHILKNNVGGRQ